MGLSRRGSRGEAPIWPGFVDAFSSLLLVLMFVLTIFLIVQFVLRQTISTQGTQLDQLSGQLQSLADALGMAKADAAKAHAEAGKLSNQLAEAQSKSDQQAALIATLNTQLQARKNDLATAQAKITDFEQQVASLLAARDKARGQAADLGQQVKDLTAARDKLQTEQQALELAVAKARKEIDAQTQAARLAAARSDALQALIASLKSQVSSKDASLAALVAALDKSKATNADLGQQVSTLQSNLSDAEKKRLAEEAAAEALKKQLSGAQDKLTAQEKQRLADQAAEEALRQKLKNSQDELTAMSLALEQQRKRAEDTLTLLAAAQAAKSTAEQEAQAKLTEAQKQAALLAVAKSELSKEKTKSADAERKVALLNAQLVAMRGQLASLQATLDASAAKDQKDKVQIDSLGSQLNAALAQVAAEQKKRADLEAEKAKLLAEQNKQLEGYRSEFFGKISKVLAGVPGVKVVGDRFVFSSEVLFPPASAQLSDAGKSQIADVASVLKDVAKQIPAGINWILQVNGYTDSTPLSGNGQYKDNWELSQARALSVVRYMIAQGFPPNRLAATGFGQYQPVAKGDTAAARAQNRRIELKLTTK